MVKLNASVEKNNACVLFCRIHDESSLKEKKMFSNSVRWRKVMDIVAVACWFIEMFNRSRRGSWFVRVVDQTDYYV